MSECEPAEQKTGDLIIIDSLGSYPGDDIINGFISKAHEEDSKYVLRIYGKLINAHQEESNGMTYLRFSLDMKTQIWFVELTVKLQQTEAWKRKMFYSKFGGRFASIITRRSLDADGHYEPILEYRVRIPTSRLFSEGAKSVWDLSTFIVRVGTLDDVYPPFILDVV